MVDVRPLIFANALFLMLLITAGFAHIGDQDSMSGSTIPTTAVSTSNVPSVSQPSTTTDISPQPLEDSKDQVAINEAENSLASAEQAPLETVNDETIFADQKVISEKSIESSANTESDRSEQPEKHTEQITSTTPNTEVATQSSTIIEPTEPVTPAAVAVNTPKAVEKPTPKPVNKPVTTGKLVVRSNVEGDTVLIDGKPYGPTRLEVELTPGTYAIEVAKNGYTGWKTEVSVSRGTTQTLKARLEHYTTVDYRNGAWINGVTTGEGSYLADDGTHYQGGFVDGKFHGSGNIRYPDASEYRGEWFEGGMQGEGTLITAQGDTFIGTFKNGEFNGEGTLTKSNGDIYTGYWVNGALNGQGSLTTKDGLLFVGGFSDNQFHGEGSLTYPDGRHYEGSFSKGQFHGKGIEIYANGKKYVGQFMEGQYHGKGELMNPNGSKITGTFKFGQPFGKATLTTPEGEIFTARTTEPGVCYRLKSYRATQCPPMEGW